MSPWTNVGLTPALRAALRASARSRAVPGGGGCVGVGAARVLPAVLGKLDEGLVFWAHAPGRERAVGEMLLRLRNREMFKDPLAGLPEIQRNLGPVRRDQEVFPPVC